MSRLTSSSDIFWAIAKGYFFDGWFFAFVHLVVLLFLRSSWQSVSNAASELEMWHPKSNQSNDGGVQLPNSGGVMLLGDGEKPIPRASQPVSILDLYVGESEKMGAQGAFVPMGDYSDRLDSIIDGLISEMQDRTNLFLIVGIAGTLFGLFEFAFLSYSELQKSDPQAGGQLLKFGEYLSRSMSKAFPVGFMGLVLTLFAQLLSARPEGRLRAALADAARRALERRKEASVSQVENLRQAVAAMQKAMQPLENLSDTLTRGLDPVRETLGERLGELLGLVKEQFDQMQQTNQNLQEAVGKLQGGVNSFGTVTTRMEDSFRQLPAMLDSLSALQNRQRESIEAFDEQVAARLQEAQKLDDVLKEAIRNFGQMPQQLAGDFKEAFNGLGNEALDAWDNYSGEYTKNLQAVYQNFLHSINGSANDVKNGLNEAANEWLRLAQNAESILKEPMRDVFATVRKDVAEDLRNLDRVVAQRYPQAAQDITLFTERLSGLLEQTNQLQGALAVWLTSARESGVQIQSLNRELIQSFNRLPSAAHSGLDPEMFQLLLSNAQQTQVVGQLLREMQKQLVRLENGVYEEMQNATHHLAGLRRDFNRNFFHRLSDAFTGWDWRGLFSKRRKVPPLTYEVSSSSLEFEEEEKKVSENEEREEKEKR
ncbi:MAG: methyl-accepting chemotaxis protein [Acidobacteriota bacterium]|nr:methyl-accepting chemotaxis protein [Acidobacteriota bacterium]